MIQKLSIPTKAGIALLVLACLGFLFDSQAFGGFSLGLGGLLLTYSGFKHFWRWLEKKYQE